MREPHWARAQLGKRVRDEASHRVGVLMDVLACPEALRPHALDRPRSSALAFIRPERGGREWETRIERVTLLEPTAAEDMAEAAEDREGPSIPPGFWAAGSSGPPGFGGVG